MNQRSRWVDRLAYLPIPLLVLAMVALWVADVRVVWSSLPLVLLIHYGSVALGVAFIVIPAARSFLATGQPSLLMLGCGILMMDVGVTAASIGNAGDLDTLYAIYNTSALLGALCHFTGVAVTSRRKIRLRRSATWLTAVYAGGVAAIGLLIWGTFTGRMPAFFIEGQGGTLLRSLVVGAAVALFVLTAGLLWQANRRTASSFLYLYALGLVLLAAGLAGSMVIAVKDSPLQWVTRFTQVVATVYMCVAVLASARKGGAEGIPVAAVEEVWRENTFLASLRQGTVLGWVLRYGLAVAAVAVAMGLRLALSTWVGPGLPAYVTFYPMVMVVALLAGFGPGLVATALASLTAAYAILPPVGQFAVASPVDRLGLVIFAGMGLFISVVAKLYRRNRAKAAAYDREVALRESQARLATFAEATFEGIVQSEAGRIVDCNEQLARMLGYSMAELRGMGIAGLIAPEDRDRVTANIRQGGESVIEHAAIRKDGTRIVVEAHGRPVAPGSARRHTAIRDITARKRAGQELRRKEAELTDAQRVAHVGSWYWDAKTDATTGSDELLRIYGLDPATQAMPDFVPQRGRCYPVEEWERVNAAVQETVQTGVGYELDVQAIRNGATIWITTRGEVVRDADGQIVGLRGTVQDITERRRAEEALRESEAKYRNLFQNMTEEVHFWKLVRDASGQIKTWRVVDANPPTLKTWGRKSLEDTVGRTADEIFPGATAHYMPVVRKIMTEGLPYSYEDYFPPPVDKYFRFTSVPLGEYFITTGADITSIKKAELALRDLNAQLENRVQQRTAELRVASLYARSLIEASLDPLVTISAEGKITDVNDASVQATGVSREDLIGTDFCDYFTEPEKARAGYEQVFREGSVRDYALELRHRDGHVTFVLYNASVYRDESGKTVGVFAAARDITERKRAEAAVLAERQRFLDVLETLPVIVTLLRPDHRVEWVNRAYREALGDNVGRLCYASQFGHDNPCPECQAFTPLKTGQPHNWEWTLPNGRTFDIHNFPFADADGSALILEMDIDITERRRAEAALKEANERLEQRVAERTAALADSEQCIRASLAEKEVLLKEIHHRVKNNMQVISSLVALQAERLPDAATRAVLQDVTHRVRSMALVHEKLYQSSDMARVEFAEYAQSLLNYLWRAHETTAPGVRLVLDLEPVPLSVNAAVPCGLILNELASNALKHAFPKREGERGRGTHAVGRGDGEIGNNREVGVTLEAGPEGRVCLRVRDNGTGLPAGLDWRQADTLGLRLVQMLAAQLHAAVEVCSGKGTEFTVTFGGPKTMENGKS